MKSIGILTQKIAPEDRIQKTWIPEGTNEYKVFKSITKENNFLASILKQHFSLSKDDLVLDVGGREGDITYAIQDSSRVHIVDPDPTLSIIPEPAKFFPTKIQNTDLGDTKYKLIICSHVLGYLGLQKVQVEVVQKLINQLDAGGTLVLFYNTNFGYMGELLAFSKREVKKGHYDYFDESILIEYKQNKSFQTKQLDVSFNLLYPSFEDLARCCWFLFGAIDEDIEGVASIFLPKLKNDLFRSSFMIDERITFIKKI